MQLISTGSFLGYTLEAYLPDNGPLDRLTLWVISAGRVVAEHECQQPHACSADSLAWVLPTLRKMARQAAKHLASVPDMGQVAPRQPAVRRRPPHCRQERPVARRMTAPGRAGQSSAHTRVPATTSITKGSPR